MIRVASATACAVLALACAPQNAVAQDEHAMHHGMVMDPAPAAPPAGPPPAENASAPDGTGDAGTDQAPGTAPPPAPAHDRAADRFWGADAMAHAEMTMMGGHSAPRYSAVRIDLAEIALSPQGDGYRWEGEAWTGDVDRLLLRTRGEGRTGGRLEQGEIEAGWSHALGPWWNLQAGVKQDIRPTPARTHAMIGFEGLAPYRFDVQALAYLSDKGQFTARFEGSLDQRITRRLVLQPRAELNFAGSDMPAERIGAGLWRAEMGLRLRYEIDRRFAPYVGYSWDWATGRTADYRRADGDRVANRAVVIGVRGWF